MKTMIFKNSTNSNLNFQFLSQKWVPEGEIQFPITFILWSIVQKCKKNINSLFLMKLHFQMKNKILEGENQLFQNSHFSVFSLRFWTLDHKIKVIQN